MLKKLGIDLGSREVKIVLMEDDTVIKKMKFSTMSFYRDFCSYDGKITVNTDKLGLGNMDAAVSTGYGRNNTDLRQFKPINEIKAHVYGVFYQTKLQDFVLLDIGGQDVKAVKVEKGIITDLDLNDKCAASCGRYLENMAAILEVPINDLFNYYENPVELNSTCAVFSESELIGKIAEGVSIERLCAGVNYSLYKRLIPILGKFNSRKLVLSGGVAGNHALIKYLSSDYEEIVRLEDSQYNGALGCCYYAEKVMSNKNGGVNDGN